MTEQERLLTATAAEAAGLVARLVGDARRTVDILSAQLDPAIYDQQPCLDALRVLIVEAGKHARVRVLVADVDALVSRGHRMIELSRRLSTFMTIQRLAEEDTAESDGFITVDGSSFLHWQAGAGYQGQGRRHDRGRCRRLERLFQERWDRSRPHPALRQLHI